MGDGYTHDPDAFDEDGEAVDPAACTDAGSVDTTPDLADGHADPNGDRTDTSEPTHPEAADRTFDWRGWVLVAAIAVCFLAIPAVILAYPYVGQQFGLSFYDTYLALPMIPAVVLAALAVWATTRP